MTTPVLPGLTGRTNVEPGRAGFNGVVTRSVAGLPNNIESGCA